MEGHVSTAIYSVKFKLLQWILTIAESMLLPISFCDGGDWARLHMQATALPYSTAATLTQRSGYAAFLNDCFEVIKLFNFIRAEF